MIDSPARPGPPALQSVPVNRCPCSVCYTLHSTVVRRHVPHLVIPGGSHGTWDYLVDHRWSDRWLGSGKDHERRRIRRDRRYSARNRRWHRWGVGRRAARPWRGWLNPEYPRRHPGRCHPDLDYQVDEEGSLSSEVARTRTELSATNSLLILQGWFCLSSADGDCGIEENRHPRPVRAEITA